MAKVIVKLTKSPINQKSDQVKTLRALGLRKMGDEREHDYSRSIRGMLIKVRHLVTTDLREQTTEEEG
ncbi:MAG: 50S ribosomal protein L30 [Dehalococcoidia bacterium]|jgi:large subunit ribosomal protein L30|tara:strand:- start:1128 stop:1331 length:204 start_codon:yes stop_codon:yes gene_type:complete